MAASPFVDHVVEMLAPLGPVEARAMFGGHGLYHAGTIFGIVYEDRVYLKVTDETRPRYEDEGMDPFTPRPGQTMRSYHEVPPEVLEDRDALVAWAKEAIQAQQ